MSENRTAERRFTTMKKGSRVYNWIHLIGLIPDLFFDYLSSAVWLYRVMDRVSR